MILKRQALHLVALLFVTLAATAQSRDERTDRLAPSGTSTLSEPHRKIVVVTGARFSYTLMEKWIEEYKKVNPDVQVIVEPRGVSDPKQYDILAEVYEHDDEIRRNRDYLHIGRYAILPVANSKSEFANVYSQRGLNASLISLIYFDDIFADQEKQKEIKAPFTVYTRLQKAGVPTVFANYFDHEQKHMKGNAIAGSDVHLVKALLSDSTGVTYLPLPLIYDRVTRKPVEGLVVLPVDLNGNKKVSDDEKFYHDLDAVIGHLEREDARIKNIPIEYLHLSVDKGNTSAEAAAFLKWVSENGGSYLHDYGYLRPAKNDFDQEPFDEFASQPGDR